MAGKKNKNKNKSNQPQNSEVKVEGQVQAEQETSNFQQKSTENNTQDIVNAQESGKTEQTTIQIKQTTVTIVTTTQVKVEQHVTQIVETPIAKGQENVSLQVDTGKQAQQQTTLEDIQVVNQPQTVQPQQQTIEHQVLDQTLNQQAAEPSHQPQTQEQEAKSVPQVQHPIIPNTVEEEHYIIPGTAVEGQFEEVSKEKKQSQVETDIKQIQDDKKVQQEQQQIEVDNSTEFQNIVEEDTVEKEVKGDVTQGKEVTAQQNVEVQLQKQGQILPQEQPTSKIQPQIEHSHIIQRKNLHEFASNQIPQLHHQDVPLQLQTTELPTTNLQQGLQQAASSIHIQPLQPVEIESQIEDKYSTVPEPMYRPQKMSLLTGKIEGQENLVKLEIISQAEGDSTQLTIDQKSAMTVISSSPEKQTENPSIIVNQNEEYNDDTQFIVLESSINQPSTNPLDTIQSTAIQVMTVTQTTQVQQIIQSMTTQDGAPLKVFVGTRQFANFAEQQVPSPAIIDQGILQQLRKKNQLEEQQKKKLQQQDQHDYWTKFYSDKRKREEEERRHFEEEQKRLKEEEEKRKLIKDKETVEKMEKEVEKELKNIKQIKNDIKDEKPFSVKLGISILASVIVGGASWFGFHDKKVTSIGTLACLALAFIAQK